MSDAAQAEAPAKGLIGAEQAARIIRVTPRRLQQLVADGYIKKTGRGQYSPIQVVHGYLDFKEEQIKQASRSADESELRRARIRQIEIQTAQLEGDLIPAAEATAILDEVIGIIRSGLAGMPARLTRDLDLRDKLEDGIDGVLRAAARRIAEAAEAAVESSGAADAGGEGDAGPMGSEEPDVPAKRRPARSKRPDGDTVHGGAGTDGRKRKGKADGRSDRRAKRKD